MITKYSCKTIDEVNTYINYVLEKTKGVSFNIQIHEDYDLPYSVECTLNLGAAKKLFEYDTSRLQKASVDFEEYQLIDILQEQNLLNCYCKFDEENMDHFFVLGNTQTICILLGLYTQKRRDVDTVLSTLDFINKYGDDNKTVEIIKEYFEKTVDGLRSSNEISFDF